MESLSCLTVGSPFLFLCWGINDLQNQIVYGTSRVNGYKIMEETLNLRDVRIFDYIEDGNGRKTAVLNKKETAIAQGKQELIKQAFADWIWSDPERRETLTKLYNEKFNSCHMHGPEHHVMVGSALLTAYHNAGGDIDLRSALTEMMNRGRSVPGGACGFWGACGAGISTGMFVSIISQSTPLTNEPFALSHKMTAKSLQAISEIGGPRCCKRDSFLSILAAIDFVREQFGVEMEKPEVVCHHSAQNNQCIGKRCPFSKVNH